MSFKIDMKDKQKEHGVKMIINRLINNEEIRIELTNDELHEAYCEFQFNTDLNCIKEILGDSPILGTVDEKHESFFEAIAEETRRLMGKYDTDFEYSLQVAVETKLASWNR